MTIHLWAGFVLASIVVLVIPGPTILTMTSYVMTSERGVRTLLVAAVALGDTTALTVSLFGIGALLATSTFWFGVVKWAGALYLVYLGASMFRRRAMRRPPNDAAVERSRLFGKMYAVTALNPKGVVFYVGFLPQFVNPAEDTLLQILVLGATFVVLATANAALYAAGASFIHRHLLSNASQRWFNRVAGSLLMAAGVWAMSIRPEG